MEQIPKIGRRYQKRKYDSMLVGTLTGLFAPWILLSLYYLIFHSHMTLRSFWGYLQLGDIFVSTLSLCVYANLLWFFCFMWTNRDKSMKGVVFATILYAVYVAIMKSI
jgi:hypothetical protein